MLHLTTVDSSTYSLLQQLFTEEMIKDNFALAGGTSLALQIGHRRSIDLDIFSPEKFNLKELETLLSMSEKIDFSYTGSNSSMLFSFINNIKCDFVLEPANLINPFIEMEGVNYFSVADIAAMKMHTICGRGKKKDFFDIYALLELYDWEQMLKWFIEKYDETQLYFLQRSILYFEDAEDDPDINGIHPFIKSWKEIKDIIISKCA